MPSDISVFVVPGLTSFFLLRFFFIFYVALWKHSVYLPIAVNYYFLFQLLSADSNIFSSILSSAISCLPSLYAVGTSPVSHAYSELWSAVGSWQHSKLVTKKKKKKKELTNDKEQDGQTQSQWNKNIKKLLILQSQADKTPPTPAAFPTPVQRPASRVPQEPVSVFQLIFTIRGLAAFVGISSS